MTDTTGTLCRDYVLQKPLIQAGEEKRVGETVALRLDQAERLAAQGVIETEASAKPGRATKQES